MEHRLVLHCLLLKWLLWPVVLLEWLAGVKSVASTAVSSCI